MRTHGLGSNPSALIRFVSLPSLSLPTPTLTTRSSQQDRAHWNSISWEYFSTRPSLSNRQTKSVPPPSLLLDNARNSTDSTVFPNLGARDGGVIKEGEEGLSTNRHWRNAITSAIRGFYASIVYLIIA